MRIGRQQIAMRREAQEFIIKAQGVIAQTDGFGLIDQLMNLSDCLIFTHAGFEVINRYTVGDDSAGRWNYIGAQLNLDRVALKFV